MNEFELESTKIEFFEPSSQSILVNKYMPLKVDLIF